MWIVTIKAQKALNNEIAIKSQNVRVDFDKIYDGIKSLATKILTIQAEGDYQAAKNLITAYAVLSPSMEIMRKKLSNMPVDIRPVFQIEKEMGDATEFR